MLFNTCCCERQRVLRLWSPFSCTSSLPFLEYEGQPILLNIQLGNTSLKIYTIKMTSKHQLLNRYGKFCCYLLVDKFGTFVAIFSSANAPSKVFGLTHNHYLSSTVDCKRNLTHVLHKWKDLINVKKNCNQKIFCRKITISGNNWISINTVLL